MGQNDDPFAPEHTVILDDHVDVFLREELDASGATRPAPRAPSVLDSEDWPRSPPPLPHDRLLKIRRIFDQWRSSGFPLTHAFDAMRAIGRILK